MNIICYPAEVLRITTEEVPALDQSVLTLIEGMKQCMTEARGIGLAAPQVGVSKRLFIVQESPSSAIRVFINPQLLYTSEELWEYEEGCLSIPEVYAVVSRSLRIRITAHDEHWKSFALNAEGMLARIILHEYDHIQGKLFIDYFSVKEQKQLLRSYR